MVRHRGSWVKASAAINLLASLVALVPVFGGVLAWALGAGLVPAVGLALAIGAGAGCAFALRRVAQRGARILANRQAEPTFRAALIAVVEARRAIDAADPSRGAPAAVAALRWTPKLGPIDRILRRVSLPRDVTSYLVWLRAEVAAATERMHDRITQTQLWRDEWLVVRYRLWTLGCILLADARRRRMMGLLQSFAGNPWMLPPAGYGSAAGTRINDEGLRGAPPLPGGVEFADCRGGTPPRVDAPAMIVEASGWRETTAPSLALVGLYIAASWFAFAVLAAIGLPPEGVALAPFLTIAAAVVWAATYALAAAIIGGSPGSIAISQLFDAVTGLDLLAALSAPGLSAALAWYGALALGVVAAQVGATRETATAAAFIVLTLVPCARLLAASLD